MWKQAIMAVALAVVGAVPGAAWADPAVEKPIRAMEKAFNAGDAVAAKATHVAMPTIIDEDGPPFKWAGKDAFDRWLAGLAATEKAEGRSDGKVAFGAAVRETVKGRWAYVVVPSTYTFKQGGRTMRETGTVTFVLAKLAEGWKIASWTWTSPEAKPVG